MTKRIILLLDGTWNDSDFGVYDTNIVRMREAISRTLRAKGSSKGEAVPGSSPETRVEPITTKNKKNIIFYERGVGTGAFLDRFFGGAFGLGLDGNIRRAYKFLSFHYEPGDQIFIFGFSRGAYTARSLVGYIHAAGLLRRETCTADLEQEAWDFYRCPLNERLPGVWSSLLPHIHDRSTLRVALLGVYDTVGALGIPASAFRVANRDTYEFHDVELSSITDVNLHALAIDEHREAFEASLWRKSKFKNFETKTEQVWFAGAHSDIGGGYVNEDTEAQREHALDDLSLDWMIKRIRHYYPDFPIDQTAWKDLDADEVRSRASCQLHDSRTLLFRLFPYAFRSISNYRVAATSRRIPQVVNVSRDRHAEPIEERIHVSVLMRAFCVPQLGYTAQNLQAVLEVIKRGYGQPNPEIGIVGWDGEPLSPISVDAILLDSHLRISTDGEKEVLK
ncbi:Uncharacterized alpha/beta hydrolase domain [Bradyrhizobium shewense]|uniref:Uncharacterized alpha/beta hydrolase domain n=1 Tax=Bradyrhizobium shewense TaxID=1761772 RepID=A0A1C3XHM0_9BRAD|nr:DUF2235 domain-containing protein [Bradyrhizobium shewense]SCB51781.1 Uncharacterized alpha/beta hydrolase domain [Bradyrhizobium shewense]